ncbi:MAG: IS630 transposase-related protein, partial [Ruminococcus sp.]|nr:IS630 transposase-related protein [Ruminococcus sp.]
TVHRWVKQYEETGDLLNKPLNRSFKKIDPEKLKAYVSEHPDDTQEEVATVFGCCPQAISQAYRRHGITRKKTLSYKEQDSEKVEKYIEKIKDIPKEKIAYVDETGIDKCLYREYGYVPHG